MKVLNIVLLLSLLICTTSCEEKTKEYTYKNETTERITCPICNGYGCNLCAQSGVPKGGGNETCASCAFYGCTTNKFGHKH